MDLPFTISTECTIGVELELQIVSPEDGNLVSRAKDLLKHIHTAQIKPEITQSMIEINSSIHTDSDALLAELLDIQTALIREGDKLGIKFTGGGTHPFQIWKERRIFPTHRFKHLASHYGYLAKYFTVFGQHIHIGCSSGDNAIYLLQAFLRYIPHFIALSASSPFYQGVDTAFDSSRVNVVRAFPTSGYMPFFKNWEEFCNYYDKLCSLHVIESIKDVYWDIRPKAEFGTIEIRICDTPLTLKKAAMLAGYAQALARYLLEKKSIDPIPYEEMLYNHNRYQASRFGFDGNLIDYHTEESKFIGDDILNTIQEMESYLSREVRDYIYSSVINKDNDARWLRETYSHVQSLEKLVIAQVEQWNK